MKKMLLPIIKKYYKLLLSTMLVMALGCGVMTGLSGAYVSLKDALNEYVEDYKYPDAVITTEISNRSTLDEVRKVDGVETIDARLCADTVMKNLEGRYLGQSFLLQRRRTAAVQEMVDRRSRGKRIRLSRTQLRRGQRHKSRRHGIVQGGR